MKTNYKCIVVSIKCVVVDSIYILTQSTTTPIYKLVNNAAVGAHAIAATVMIFIYVNRDNVVAPLTETYLKWLRVNNKRMRVFN